MSYRLLFAIILIAAIVIYCYKAGNP